jgi:HTH-type transcriptional regulator, competence development regulator
MKSLGTTLKEARELTSFKLRQVEEATGISNAYLSQLENDKIKKPSANVLYKLATIYKIELNTLLGAAGIIEKGSKDDLKDSSEWDNRIAFYTEDLSEEQKEQVLDYIKYLKFRK